MIQPGAGTSTSSPSLQLASSASKIADVFTVFAKIDGKKFSAFLVRADSEGLEIGRDEPKMGILGSNTTALSFDNVKVPKANLLGEEGKGHKIAFNILNMGRLRLGVAVMGGAKHVLSMATKYAKDRKQFGIVHCIQRESDILAGAGFE